MVSVCPVRPSQQVHKIQHVCQTFVCWLAGFGPEKTLFHFALADFFQGFLYFIGE